MRSRLLSTASALVLVSAACAQGSSVPVGVGGSSAAGPATTGSSSQHSGAGAATSAGSTSASGPSTSGSTSTTTMGSTTTGPTTTSVGVTSSSGNTCSASPCKLTEPQCGCQAGQVCTVNQTSVGCGMAGSTGETQSCTGPSQCAEGLLCVQSGSMAGATAICEKFCDTDADCTAPGGLCIVTLNNGMGGSIPNVKLCTDNCDPFTNAGCSATGTACQIGQEPTGQMRFLTLCGEAGALGKGQTCDPMNNQCAPTFGCFMTTTMGNECFQYCQYGSPLACPTCAPLQDSAMQPIFIGTMQVGVCQ